MSELTVPDKTVRDKTVRDEPARAMPATGQLLRARSGTRCCCWCAARAP
jgi:hypothetical protein